ncbi:MAG: AAA family ATPase [Candidatus Micrarchaeota archaeon]
MGKQAILLTGSPGTGKTEVARAFCKKFGWKYLSLTDLVNEYGLYSKIDEKDKSRIAELEKLQKIANEKIHQSKKPVLVEGHLGCEIELKVQRVLVLRLNPVDLVNRLEKRRYSKAKVEKNMLAEVLDYCTLTSEKCYRKSRVFELDTTGMNKSDVMKALIEFTASRELGAKFRPHINWTKMLLK